MPKPSDKNLNNFINMQNSIWDLQKKRQDVIDEQIKQLYAAGIDTVFVGAGWGRQDQQIHNNFSRINRYGTRFCMDNYLRTGYLFMTRPELNLQPTNLKQDRIMNVLNSWNPNSLQYAIRAYLDSRFSRIHADLTAACPFIDYRSPFMTIITNNVTGFTGSPTYQLRDYTEEAGYFGEAQSMPIGSDSYKQPFDINLEVIDPIGGPIEAIMKFWTRYIDLVTQGVMIMYPDQEFERVMNYTVSFYRFIMDPSFRFIKKWAKYTGCFPISRPGASIFDYSAKDIYVDGLRKYSIAFKCGSGHVDEDDPIVIEEFNMLVERYFTPIRCLRPDAQDADNDNRTITRSLIPYDRIDDTLKGAGLRRTPLIPECNYMGIPYILDTSEGLRLEFISQVNEGPANMKLVVFPLDQRDRTTDNGNYIYEYRAKFTNSNSEIYRSEDNDILASAASGIAQQVTEVDDQIDSTINQYQSGAYQGTTRKDVLDNMLTYA